MASSAPLILRLSGYANLGTFLNGSARLVIKPGRCTIDANGLLGLFAGAKQITQSSGSISVRHLPWRPFWMSTRVQLATGEFIDVSRWSIGKVRAALEIAGLDILDVRHTGVSQGEVARRADWPPWLVPLVLVGIAVLGVVSAIDAVHAGGLRRMQEVLGVLVCLALARLVIRRARG